MKEPKNSGLSLLEKLLLLGMVSSVVFGIVFSERFGLVPRLLGGPPAMICVLGLLFSRRRSIESWIVLPLLCLLGGMIFLLSLEGYHHFQGTAFEQTFTVTLLVTAPFTVTTVWSVYKYEKRNK